MKIRTDFVTNSSSSSFAVELTIKTLDGDTIRKTYGDLDDEVGGDVSVEGDIKKLVKAGTVGELMNLLKIEYQADDAEYEDYDDEEDEEDEEGMEGSPDAGLESVTIKRSWMAWGEASSCFGANVDYEMPKLKELAAEVVNAEGDAREEARKKLAAYVEDLGEVQIEGNWGTEWPGNICKANGTNKLVWEGFAEDIDDLAEKIMDDELPNDDYAEEIVKIDYTTKKTEAVNLYYLKTPSIVSSPAIKAFYEMDDMVFAKEKIREIVKAAEWDDADELLKKAETIETKDELMKWVEKYMPDLEECLGYEIMEIVYM